MVGFWIWRHRRAPETAPETEKEDDDSGVLVPPSFGILLPFSDALAPSYKPGARSNPSRGRTRDLG